MKVTLAVVLHVSLCELRKENTKHILLFTIWADWKIDKLIDSIHSVSETCYSNQLVLVWATFHNGNPFFLSKRIQTACFLYIAENKIRNRKDRKSIKLDSKDPKKKIRSSKNRMCRKFNENVEKKLRSIILIFFFALLTELKIFE